MTTWSSAHSNDMVTIAISKCLYSELFSSCQRAPCANENGKGKGQRTPYPNMEYEDNCVNITYGTVNHVWPVFPSQVPQAFTDSIHPIP